jgi:hypothetical protein
MARCDTCFVLGAGFSVPASLPTQADILKKLPASEIANICRIFGVQQGATNIQNVSLEDVFTFLDKIINGKEAARIPSANGILDVDSACQIERGLTESIIRLFDPKQKTAVSIPCYNHFFNEIVRRKKQGTTNTIITLNWDTVPDFYINRAFKSAGISKGGVDYCCYDWDWDDKDNYESSIMRKAKGYTTIKLLKLHGSFNWRFSKVDDVLYVKEQNGANPQVLLLSDEVKNNVVPPQQKDEYGYIVKTPTLLKDFGNVHLKMIWNNAGIDLRDAKRIVFLGYSLPTADFEFRYLLLKHVVRRRDVDIRVLIYDRDPRRNEITNNYKNLFVGNTPLFEYGDVRNFLMDDYKVWNW